MKLTKEDKKRIILEEHLLKDDIPLSFLARKYGISRGALLKQISNYFKFTFTFYVHKINTF